MKERVITDGDYVTPETEMMADSFTEIADKVPFDLGIYCIVWRPAQTHEDVSSPFRLCCTVLLPPNPIIINFGPKKKCNH